MTELFPELQKFSSSTTLILTHYHGQFEFNKNYKYVIYTSFGEACNHKELSSVIDYFDDSFIIVVTTRKYENFNHLSDRYRVISIPSAYAWYSQNISNENLDILQRKITRKFLSLNNRAQWNRQALFQFLVKFNLLDQFYFSYYCSDRFGVGSTKLLFDHTNQIIGNTWFNQGLNLDTLFKMLPMVTGVDTVNDTDPWTMENPVYYNTFCSIVTDTYIDENYDPFFTEKIFKPLAFGHPFFLCSSAGALQLLRSLGFKTFDNIFDEAYDSIESPQLRFEFIFKEIQRICNLSNAEILSMHNKILPQLEYNRNFFYFEFGKQYAKDIVKVLDIINNIIA